MGDERNNARLDSRAVHGGAVVVGSESAPDAKLNGAGELVGHLRNVRRLGTCLGNEKPGGRREWRVEGIGRNASGRYLWAPLGIHNGRTLGSHGSRAEKVGRHSLAMSLKREIVERVSRFASIRLAQSPGHSLCARLPRRHAVGS